MQNKYLRFFIIEPQFRLRFLAFAFLMFILSFQLRELLWQQQQLSSLKRQKDALVYQREMNNKIQQEQIMGQKSSVEPALEDTPFILEGISFKKGVWYALINGTIVKSGDTISNYNIIDIKKNLVILENKTTKSSRQLYFKK